MCITRMFKAEVPEKIIVEKSGHKSLKSLRGYEHTSSEQQQAAGRVITKGGQFLSYNDSEQEQNGSRSAEKPYMDVIGLGQHLSKSDIPPF